jgi:hypothetical protein
MQSYVTAERDGYGNQKHTMKSQFVIAVVEIIVTLCVGLSTLSTAATAAETASDVTDLLIEWELEKRPLETAEPQVPLVVDVFQAIGEVFAELTGIGAAEPVAPLAADPQPLEQQFEPQFAQLLKVELRFVRSTCQPTPGQYKTIKTAGNVGLKAAVKKCASVQMKMQQGIRAGQQSEWPDPRRIIAEELARSIQQTLSSEQSQRYQLELEKRAAARKRAALLNLVAKLDQDLVLTAEQRTQLTEQLNANWNDTWGQQLEVFMYGGQFMPLLPDNQVLPVLNDTQKEIWKGMPKNQSFFGGWMGFAFVQPGEFMDDVEVPEVVEDKSTNLKDAAGDKP